MNETTKKVLRDNWYLVAIFCVVLVAAGLGYVRSVGASAPVETTPDVESHLISTQETGAASNAEDVTGSKRDDVAAVLEDYRAKYEADPKGKDAPALLAAMGNLYRQKQGNYMEAAQCFERLISEHPDAPGIRDAYLQLVTCYERAGDRENRQRVLRRIVEVYPADSQEHAYASTQLYQ